MLDWSRVPVRIGVFVLGGAGGAVMAAVTGLGAWGVAGAGGVGLALVFAGHLWWKSNFEFPDTLTPTVRRGLSSDHGTGWAVDLTFENPGHTATFEVTYESVEGTDHVGATPDSYVNWRGHAGDAKEIAGGREARLHLCDWPNRNSPPNPTSEYNAVTHSSTGQVVHKLARVASPDEDVRRQIRYRLQAFCKETERTVGYEVEVTGLNDLEPEVAAERLDT